LPPADGARHHPRVMVEQHPPTRNRRALLIDDEPVIRFALRRFFERQGWVVDEAEDGHGALALLLDDGPNARTYDVVITDLRMPGLSGMELHARLERERPAVLRRMILTTGDTVSPDAAAFLQRSTCPVLGKPFELAELRALVARIAGTE
jgi:DNA-binding response OmpR family regulator